MAFLASAGSSGIFPVNHPEVPTYFFSEAPDVVEVVEVPDSNEPASTVGSLAVTVIAGTTTLASTHWMKVTDLKVTVVKTFPSHNSLSNKRHADDTHEAAPA